MDIITGFIIFAAGIVIGIFAQKTLLASTSQSNETEQKLNQREQELTQYKLNVAEHLDDSAALLKKMNETCQIAMAQMEKSTALLQQATPAPVQEDLPFFSEETTAELQNTVSLRQPTEKSKGDIKITEAPLDYSGDASGIFSDKKHPVTNS